MSLTIASSIFFVWLAIMMFYSSTKLIISTRCHYLSEFKSHRTQFFSMMVVLYLCLGATIYEDF